MAGKAKVEVEIKASDKASKQMDRIGKRADKMAANFAKAGAIMVGVGVAIVGSLFKISQSYAKAGDAIAKMAKRTGFGTIALSELKHAAEISGASLDDIEKSTKKLSKAIIDARRGLETYVRVFDDLGIKVEELEKLSPEEQFFAVASALGELEDQTLQTALAVELFGRSGTNLLPMLEEGADGIAALRAEAHELGIVFDEEAAAAAEAFTDAQLRLNNALEGLKNAIAKAVMPKLEEFVDMLTQRLKPAMEWLDKHPEVTQAFLTFGLLFLAGGAIMLGLAGFIKILKVVAVTVTAVRTALIAMYAFTGPQGIALLIAGVAALGGTLAAVNAIVNATGGSAAGVSPTPEALELARSPEGQDIADKIGFTIPGFASGGLVTRPTLAMVGESGPEAIIPLGAGRMGAPIYLTVHVGAWLGDETGIRQLASLMSEYIREEQRTYQNAPTL